MYFLPNPYVSERPPLQLQAIHDNLPAHPTAFLVKGTAGGKWEISPISKYKTSFEGVPDESVRFFIFSGPPCRSQDSTAYNWLHRPVFLTPIPWLATLEHPCIPSSPFPRNKIAQDPLLERHHPSRFSSMAFSFWYFPSRGEMRAGKKTHGCGVGTNDTEQTCTSYG
jgi:hypothetical protein